MNDWTLDDILGGPDGSITAHALEGERATRIRGVASIGDATTDDLAFCIWDPERAAEAVSVSNAGIILCRNDLRGTVSPRPNALLVFMEQPRLAFVRFAARLERETRKRDSAGAPLIAATAVIDPAARLGAGCAIGEFTMIGPGCEIGENTVIHNRVTLVRNCRIGANCVIQSGVTLGESGFAYERYEDGSLERFPHFRGVVVGDNVEICANTNIAGGSLTDTVIGAGTKIDAMVHIAHNVQIGRDCMLTAGTIIGGSVAIGDSTWMGLNSTVKHRVTIGANVVVGAAACVLKDVPDGDVVAGVPAKSIKPRVTTDELFLMAGQKAEAEPARG
jgi:UDP-3-O-[3-hydroxymyristoyl] glucosamine N-acyltransferase